MSIVLFFLIKLVFRTCTKKSNGNVRREDDRSWSSTSVDSKILKWSSNAIKWPVSNSLIRIEFFINSNPLDLSRTRL